MAVYNFYLLRQFTHAATALFVMQFYNIKLGNSVIIFFEAVHNHMLAIGCDTRHQLKFCQLMHSITLSEMTLKEICSA